MTTKHFAKKSLGQNFLKSDAVLAKIRDAADVVGNDIVLEIGPGLGALTEVLLKFAGKVIAIEKDDSLYVTLQTKFDQEIAAGKLDLIHGDVMNFDPEILRNYCDGKLEVYKLVANIPYNITGAIIEKFLSVKFQPTMMVLMVQKEVAERIVAKNNKPGRAGSLPGKESILSIAVKAYGVPTYISTVKAGNFVPAPSVDSAIIKIDGISRDRFKNAHHEQVFFQVMKAGFAHKRKTLAGNLKNILEPSIVDGALQAVGLHASVRAEDVPIEIWHNLADFVYHHTYN